MNRISRTVSAAVLSAMLFLAVAPAAQARTHERRQAPKPAVTWIDMALAWLGDLGLGIPAAQDFTKTTTTTSTTYPTSGVGMSSPMTSSGLDPNGGGSTHP